MAVIPSVDLGLMAEHLAAHEGVITKLKYYETLLVNHKIKELIHLQLQSLYSHVDVMLNFINPYQDTYVEVPPLYTLSNDYPHNGFNHTAIGSNDKWITLEVHNTTKNMSMNNYMSALMMKNPKVRDAHIEMALQDLELQKRYGNFIEKMNWSYTPHATVEEQVKTYQRFQHILRD